MSDHQFGSTNLNQPYSNDEPVTLLLLGGGIRYPAFAGALRAVEKKGLKIGKIVGSSTGSIIAALYAIGATPDELCNEVLEVETSVFKDISVRSILTRFGLCSGNRLESWVDKRIEGRCFKDDFHIPIEIIATDILNYRPVIFSSTTHPELKVATAARFSSGVPGIFAYCPYNHHGKEQAFVDGSLMTGAIEETYGRNERVLILRVVSKRTLKQEPGKLTFVRYCKEVLNFSLHAIEKEFIKGGRWKDSILLYCAGIEPARFTLDIEEKEYLIEQGYEQTMKFLQYKWGI